MAFVAKSTFLGEVDFSIVDVSAPGTIGGADSFYNEILSAYDPVLGGAEFLFCKYAGTLTVGQVVEVTPSLSGGVLTFSATPWTGTANSGKPLGVVYVGGTSANYGWVQVGGAAIASISGSPVAGNPVYWQSTGVVSPTPVASKQMVNAVFATAPSVTLGSGAAAVTLTAAQAVVNLQRPFAQGAIT